jgi:hypothetical protein
MALDLHVGLLILRKGPGGDILVRMKTSHCRVKGAVAP